MAATFQDILLRVKEGADIVSIVGQYVPLKRAGSRYLGMCPFHNDRHPSMNVNPRMGIYKCFACGAGGDAIKFVQEFEKVGFPEALRLVAAKAGIPIPENLSFGEKGDADKTAAVAQANQIALQVYVEALEKTPAFLKYLEERGLSRETVKHFQIGCAPESADALLKKAEAKKIPVASFIEAGILGEAGGGRIFDRFSGRLMFPIFNLSGRVIAFGGRIAPGKDGPKYINTPESPLYQKSRVLYGFNFARPAIDQSGEAVLVEGYMDLVSLWQAGVRNAVAVCGTALTAAHAQTLSRFAKRAVLFFDGDSAGRNAVHRSLEPLLAQGVEIRVPVLPASEDPDSFARAHAPEEIRALFEAAEDLPGFLVRAAGASPETFSPERKDALVKEAAALLAHSPSPVVREEHLQSLRRRLGLRATAAAATPHPRFAPAGGPPSLDEDLGLFVPGSKLPLHGGDKPEWQLLQLALFHADLALSSLQGLDLDWLFDARVRDLLDHFLAFAAEGRKFSLIELVERVSDPLKEALQALEPSDMEPEKARRMLADLVFAVEYRYLREEQRRATSLERRKELQDRIRALNSGKF